MKRLERVWAYQNYLIKRFRILVVATPIRVTVRDGRRDRRIGARVVSAVVDPE